MKTAMKICIRFFFADILMTLFIKQIDYLFLELLC